MGTCGNTNAMIVPQWTSSSSVPLKRLEGGEVGFVSAFYLPFARVDGDIVVLAELKQDGTFHLIGGKAEKQEVSRLQNGRFAWLYMETFARELSEECGIAFSRAASVRVDSVVQVVDGDRSKEHLELIAVAKFDRDSFFEHLAEIDKATISVAPIRVADLIDRNAPTTFVMGAAIKQILNSML